MYNFAHANRVDGRYFFRVLPRLVTVPPPGMAPCAMGSIVEVLVSATGNYIKKKNFDINNNNKTCPTTAATQRFAS